MLQIVMRSSIERPRIADPVYSNTLAVPPPIPIFAMTARMMSFAVTPGFKLPVDANLEGLRGLLQQALRGEHMANLRRADAERECAKGTVGSSVAIPANDRHARLRKSLLRSDDVNDALVVAHPVVEADAEVGAVLSICAT